MEKYSIYINKFKIALGILVAAIIIVVFLISKAFPELKKINEAQSSYKSTSASLVDAERKLENLKISKAKAAENDNNLMKAFFKPINGGSDTESAISDEFGEILQIMRENKIKIRSFKYVYDPEDDNFVVNAASKYHVCKVTADIIATYSQFESFLRELFKHEHFLEISSIEIIPYKKNKRILLINMQYKLYAQRDPSSIVETPKTEEASSKKDSKNSKAKSSKSSSSKEKSKGKGGKKGGDGAPPDITREK